MYKVKTNIVWEHTDGLSYILTMCGWLAHDSNTGEYFDYVWLDAIDGCTSYYPVFEITDAEIEGFLWLELHQAEMVS